MKTNETQNETKPTQETAQFHLLERTLKAEAYLNEVQARRVRTEAETEIKLHTRVRPFGGYYMEGEVIEIGYSSLCAAPHLVFGVKWDNGTRGYFDESEVTSV